jgi:hypothetical protein
MHYPVPKGSVTKNADYLKIIKNNTLNPGHPRHHGILVQAHHVLSADGIKLSKMGKSLVECGYDINTLENLVFIPSTLQGACHLNVQPHRGNHTATAPESELDDETGHADSYHLLVQKAVRELRSYLEKGCPGGDRSKSKRVIAEMNKRSEKILKLIQNSPRRAMLTAVALNFDPNNSIGCGGLDNIKKGVVVRTHCPVGRDHQHNHGQPGGMAQGKTQRDENIKYAKEKPFYKLHMGK